MKFRVIVPVYVEWDEIEVIVDHGTDPGEDEDARFEIFEKAIQIAIMERPLVPWFVEENDVLWELDPDMTKLIKKIDD